MHARQVHACIADGVADGDREGRRLKDAKSRAIERGRRDGARPFGGRQARLHLQGEVDDEKLPVDAQRELVIASRHWA